MKKKPGANKKYDSPFVNYRLRPLMADDLRLVLRWRNSDRVRKNMITQHKISVAEHLAWFERIRRDDSQKYYVFEFRKRPCGLISIKNMDKKRMAGSWGFYIGVKQRPRETGVVMGTMALDRFFKSLRLKRVYGQVLYSNATSHRFHERLGFRKMDYKGPMRETTRAMRTSMYGLKVNEWAHVRREIMNMVKQLMKGKGH